MKIDEKLIKCVKNIPPEVLENHGVISVAKAVINEKPTYICPLCDNGTGKDGIEIQPTYFDGIWLYYCFVCNKILDNIKFLAIHYNLDSKLNFPFVIHRKLILFQIPKKNLQ